MKQLKINPTKLIAMSVITIALSSCMGQTELTNSTFQVISTKAGYTAGYTDSLGKMKVIIPGENKGNITANIVGTYPISSLILDQRASDRTTNWNWKNGNKYPLLKFNVDPLNPTLYVTPLDQINSYIINSEPTTPALYNELCADKWDEPVANGELSKCWKLYQGVSVEIDGVMQPANPIYQDDKFKFSAFDNKLSYKPGSIRSSDFDKIVSPSKSEVFATFTVGEELIPNSEYIANPELDNLISKTKKAEFVNIEYSNGTDKYSLKIYKSRPSFVMINGETWMTIYIVSTKNISSFETLVAIPDSEYAK